MSDKTRKRLIVGINLYTAVMLLVAIALQVYGGYRG